MEEKKLNVKILPHEKKIKGRLNDNFRKNNNYKKLEASVLK